MSQVSSITIQVSPSDHDVQPYRYSRTPVESIELVVGHGIQGDLKAGKNPKRQVNIMTAETLEQLGREGFQTAPGQMGEQIIVSGLDVNGLASGDRLQIGTAVIEIHERRNGCAWFEQIQGLSPKLAAGRLGQIAFVVESGTVKLGDTVSVVQAVATAG